ncbi:MAG: hypothetical protein GY757_18415, partial [bacterium]|nr:hypothetical protein [bacterium]
MKQFQCKSIQSLFLLLFFLTLPFFGAPSPPPLSGTAALEQSVFSARGEKETLLHISKPGRYSIQVKSKQGTYIEVVDRMAGPFKSAGAPGKKNGRIDLILDKGSYKIRLKSHPDGTGKATLSVFPFSYANTANVNSSPAKKSGRVSRIEDLPFLQNLELMEGDLKDLQQNSFWLHIKKRKILRLEMLGRSLRDARLWKDGSWLEDMTPTITSFTPIPGQPMTHIEFYHDINPGLYLLTCYGGPAQLWTKESALSPFFLRMG